MNKKTLFLVIIVISSMITILLIDNIKPLESKKKDDKKEHVKIEMVTPDERNELTVTSFIHELLGTNYLLLIYLFEPNSLDRNVYEMTEIDEENYAKEIGDKIKEGKILVEGKISNMAIVDDYYKYNVILLFSDGSKKELLLKLKEGKIITPINEIIDSE